ncbi:MAG TPA: aromatic ring-hydroxylating dioxygenase subunit alpha [Rubrivivax sp.]|nr:aromatic ring-hydroxylating dioxygenase subunit alpha [Rubrivivax sp.]
MSALSDWWLPLAAATGMACGRCLSAHHFEQPLVLWQGDGGPAVFDDRCPHRGASLSLGRVQGATLECPYHGWRFAHDGRCVAVPAVPGFQPPAGHGARRWQLLQRHGLLWAAGASAAQAEPYAPPPLDELPRKRVLCGPFDVATSAPRVVENFLDTAHFGFVHEGWLGTREHVEVPAYEVEPDALGRPGVPHYRAWQPQASSAATGGAWIDYRYQLLSPLSALLHKRAGAADGFEEAYVLWTAPTGRESCRAWFTIATADAGADAEVLRRFQQTIFAQDQPVLESQRPRELPLSGGELHSAADRFSAAYRRWLRGIGFAYGCC